jgi:tetratricopeptide (TPR) repeat protein
MAATSLILRPSEARARAVALHSQALRLTSRGRYQAAFAAHDNALRLAESGRALDPILVATFLNDFGVLCKFMGRFRLAERMYRRALWLLARKNEDCKQSLATLYHNLGGLEHARGRYRAALRLARQGLALRKTARPRDTIALIDDQSALAAILTDLGRTREAAKIYRRVLHDYRRRATTRFSSKYESKRYEIGSTMANLGALYAKMGRLAPAERSLRRGMSFLEKAVGKTHPRLAIPLNNLAVVCTRRGAFRESEALYRRVLRLLKMQSGRTYPSASVVRQNYRKSRVLDSQVNV